MKKLITPEQAAELLGVSARTLSAWRSHRRTDGGLPFVKVGSSVRYRPEDIEKWLSNGGQPTTLESAAPYNPRRQLGQGLSGVITVTGAAQLIHRPGISHEHITGQLVGLAELGGNNAENPFGWSGLKCIVVAQQQLWLVDFPAMARLGSTELEEWGPSELYAHGLPLGLLNLRDQSNGAPV